MCAGRYSTSRQKSCLPCSASKIRCDRRAGTCTRCAKKAIRCTYVGASSTDNNSPRNAGTVGRPAAYPSTASDTAEVTLPSPDEDLATSHPPAPLFVETEGAPGSPLNLSLTIQSGIPSTDGGFDFSNLDLVCPINADEISNRWLNSYIPVPGQKEKQYDPSIRAFIYQMLKAYTSVAVHGRGVPPFIHASQTVTPSANLPLSTCLSIVRICDKPVPGGEDVAAEILEREMSKIYEQRESYDSAGLLAAFQAYLILSMVFFYHVKRGTCSYLRQAVMNLQELACLSARAGLVCTAEQHRIRPRWEAWIVAEAKRRTLFAMYLFDNVLASQDGMSSYLGSELHGLLGPSTKTLWQASDRAGWETAYNAYLAEWPSGGARIDELWPIPGGMSDPRIEERRARVDHWLEQVDEFGTMVYAVTSCTHGC